MVRDLGPELVEAQRAADPLAEDLRQTVLTGAGDMAERMEDELDGEFIQGLEDDMEGGLVGAGGEYETGGNRNRKKRSRSTSFGNGSRERDSWSKYDRL